MPAFESALARRVRASHAVACSSGTAALHLSMLALDIGPGDVVVTSPITFLASANCARYVGAEVRFTDVDPGTGLMDPSSLEQTLEADAEHKIKAVIPVHLAGQPADLSEIRRLTRDHGARLVGDACHALGAVFLRNGDKYFIGGSPHADLTVFSFHPVKHVAMGEGGAVTSNNPALVKRLQLFRNHGMQKENLTNEELAYEVSGDRNPWYYEMQELGFNYRLSDIHAGLGLSQLTNLSHSVRRRNQLADSYIGLIKQYFPDGPVRPLAVNPGVFHAYHLFIVLVDFERYGKTRAEVMRRLRAAGIGSQVHYIPIYMQPYYAQRYDIDRAEFPGAESYYARALSLPMYPELTDNDVERVIVKLAEILNA